MESSFVINWGAVSGCGTFLKGMRVYALWPAPVNEDQCFAEAGFNHFKFEDDCWSEAYWDKQAEILQVRLISTLSKAGAPTILSKPLRMKRSMFHLWQLGEPIPLIEQLRGPILNDSLPEVRIRFGEAVDLRAGLGHEIYWIGLHSECQDNFDTLLSEITMGWKVVRVQLDWSRLGYADSTWQGDAA